jgi:hypothetical protein
MSNVILFRPKAEAGPKTDEEIRRYLRSVYLDRDQPFRLRVRAAIMAPYFGENVIEVMRVSA